ncbi:MAG: hypothetical protein AAF293_02680 [Pseudomonadota bacterium]
MSNVANDLGLTCLIALDNVEEILPGQLRRAMSYVAPRSSLNIQTGESQDAEQSLVLEIDRQVFGCGVYSGRIPDPEFSFALRKSIFWNDAAESMATHSAFLAISAAEVTNRHGLIRAQAVALTRLVASLAEVLPSSGILWHGSQICTSPQRIAAAPAEIAQGKWPADIWVGYQFLGQNDAKRPFLGLQTRGAAEYLGFEMEVPPFFVDDRKEPLRILYNAVGYLMNYGDVIKDGQLVEVEGERRTRYQLQLGANGEPGLARLAVLPTDHRRLN